jgi:hypothetical protein
VVAAEWLGVVVWPAVVVWLVVAVWLVAVLCDGVVVCDAVDPCAGAELCDGALFAGALLAGALLAGALGFDSFLCCPSIKLGTAITSRRIPLFRSVFPFFQLRFIAASWPLKLLT